MTNEQNACNNIETKTPSQFASPDTLSSCDILDNYKNATVIKNPILHDLMRVYLNNQTKQGEPFYIKTITFPFLNDLINKCVLKIESYVECAKGINLRLSAGSFENVNVKGYVLRLPVSDDEKVIILGDFHGSFHSFFRTLFRLHFAGILDLMTFKVMQPYRLVFLGDIVDRGMYALEILYIILHLIDANEPGYVVLNRGNHEDPGVNAQGGFYKEVCTKMATQMDQNDTIDLFTRINNFFIKCSVAVVVENKGKRYWLSHGGIPRIKVLEWDDTKNYICLRSETMIVDIMWADFSRNNTSTCGYRQSETRGASCIIIETQYLKEFMERNNITFIVRGHQDFYSNSYLFSSEQFQVGSEMIDGTNFSEKTKGVDGVYNLNDYKQSPTRMFGPIARVNIDSNRFYEAINGVEYYPVITLSTATDYGRFLKKDSFSVLRFDPVGFNFKNHVMNVKTYRLEKNIIQPVATAPFSIKDVMKQKISQVEERKTFLADNIEKFQFTRKMIDDIINMGRLVLSPLLRGDVDAFRLTLLAELPKLMEGQINMIFEYVVDNM
jgi:hypothetical protein